MRVPARTRARWPRRTTDRVEDAAAWVLWACVLALGVAVVAVGLSVHDTVAARARLERAARMPATAVLAAGAPVSVTYPPGDVRVGRPAVRLERAGVRHTGPVQVTAGTPAGAAVPVWIDRSGAVVPAPREESDAVLAGLVVAGVVLAAGVIVLGGGWSGVRHLVGLANAAAWEREWARVGPLWRRGDDHPDSRADRPRGG